MRQLVVYPTGFVTKLKDCPPGLFVYGDELCFKSEYYDNGKMEVFVVSSGEAFWGGVASHKEKGKLSVMPCDWRWEDVNE